MPEYHFSNSNAHLQLLSTCSCRIFLADIRLNIFGWTYSSYFLASRIFFDWFLANRNSAINPDNRIPLGALGLGINLETNWISLGTWCFVISLGFISVTRNAGWCVNSVTHGSKCRWYAVTVDQLWSSSAVSADWRVVDADTDRSTRWRADTTWHCEAV